MFMDIGKYGDDGKRTEVVKDTLFMANVGCRQIQVILLM